MDRPNRTIHSFIFTNRMHRRTVDRVVAESGIELHRSQFLLLVHLKRRGDSFSQRELAEHLGISPAALAVKIKRLESDGLIVRVKEENDCRINFVSITEKGISLLDKARRLFSGIDNKMLEGIEEKDLQVFERCLLRMQANLERIHDNPEIIREEQK